MVSSISFDFYKYLHYKTRQSVRMRERSIVFESGVDHLDKPKRSKIRKANSQIMKILIWGGGGAYTYYFNFTVYFLIFTSTPKK